MFKLPQKLNLFKSKKVTYPFFTIDIGSNAVKSAAFDLDEERPNTLKLVGISKEMLEPNSVRAGNIVETSKVIESVDNALFKTVEGIDFEVSNAIFGISGDLCLCQITTVRINRGHNQEISQKEVDEINSKIIESAFAQAQNKLLKTTGVSEVELELITSSTIYAKVDDNKVNDLAGNSGYKIEQAFFTAFAPTHHLKKIQEIANALKLNIIAVAPNMYALVQSLRTSFEDNVFDGVIMDIGSDKTDVGIVFGGGIIDTMTLNIGGEQFTNRLSEDTGITQLEAETKKHDYTFGNLQDNDHIRTENILNEVAGIWLDGIEILFSEFNGVKTFPTDVYITGGGSKLPLITEALDTNPWTKAIPFREPPEYKKISTKVFGFIHDVTGDSDQGEFVIPTALSVIYLEMNKFEND
jgi:cell division ATPase FtsA